MVTVRLVTRVFLDDDDLGRFMLSVLVLFGLSFVAMLTIVRLFRGGRMTVIRMDVGFLTVGMLITGVGMAMGMEITEIVGVSALVRVSVVRRRSLVRMDDVLPRFTQVAVERVDPRSVAIGTVLTRLLILFCARSSRKINNPARRQANVAEACERFSHVDAIAGLTFQNDLHG